VCCTMTDTKPNKPDDNAFKQQKLPAWQPILTPKPVIISFLVIGIVFIPVGYALFDASQRVVEVQSNAYENENGGSFPLQLPYMKAPVYFYYKLENFYQNHRRYVKSRSDTQLLGQIVTSSSSITDCDPYTSVNGSSDPQYFYLPCGLIARSLFNDTFLLYNSNNTVVNWTSDGIAWDSDINDKFNNPPANAPGIRTIPNFKDPDFVVWMRAAALPTFRKLYRIIQTDIQPGLYTVRIWNNYPVTSFGGHKYVVLSTTSWLGGKNPFLGYAYMVVGAVCILLGVSFAIKHAVNGRRLGDTAYLDWAQQ